MPEFGFFHPTEGYWQAVSEVSDDLRQGYPEGTIEVPLRPGPGYVWAGTEWVESAAPPAPVPPTISFAQLLIGLVAQGWITEAEGDAWLTGTLPELVNLIINTLPADQRFRAKARAIRPSVIDRNDPLVAMLAVAQGRTPEQLDDFFRVYSTV